MTIPEASSLVIQASVIGNSGEILLFEMGKPVKIYNLAKKMIDLYGNNNNNIVIGNLRAGEKLYEELLCKGENIIPTKLDKIMKLKQVEDIDYDKFFNIFDKIINLEYSDIFELKNLLKIIVPDYKPK